MGNMGNAQRFIGLISLTLLGAAYAGCVNGSDLDGSGGSDGENRPNSGSAGESSSSSGDSSSSGEAGSSSSGGPATCDDPATPCFDQACLDMGKPFIPADVFPPCPTDICSSGGHCVANGNVPGSQADLLAACDADNKCVPDRLIETKGSPEPIVCESLFGAEGRCLSECIPQVKEQGITNGLPTAGCDAGHFCVPCYSPIDGSDTGACTLGNPGCDAPQEPPAAFKECCADKGGGKCIPLSIVGAAADQLDKEECASLGQPDSACVPNVIFDAQQAGATQIIWPSCTTGGFIGGGAEGVCVPKCVPSADSFLVSQGDCSEDYENCAPCEMEVLGFPIDTGACEPVNL
jgi:hypothetical protein